MTAFYPKPTWTPNFCRDAQRGSHRILILQGKARANDTNELSANFAAAPPDHPVSVFPNDTIAGQEQHKFVGNVEALDMEPHAAVGNVDNLAVAR